MSNNQSLSQSLDKFTNLIDKNHVQKMLELQACTLDRMETTNLVLTSCYSVAQKKLSDTNKVVKVCSKKLNDSKRDLDVVYKKLTLLKSKIKEEYPVLHDKHSHLLIKDKSLADEDDT